MTKEGEKEREAWREESHVEDTSFNVTFIILQEPLENGQPWDCVEHTALMTTAGETVNMNGHQMFKENGTFFSYLYLFLIVQHYAPY